MIVRRIILDTINDIFSPSKMSVLSFCSFIETGFADFLKLHKGPSTKDVRQMGRGGGGVVLKFRTFPDGGRGGWFVKVRTSENF